MYGQFKGLVIMHPNSIIANKRNLLKGRISNALNAVTQVERLWNYTTEFSMSFELQAIEYNNQVQHLRTKASIVYEQLQYLERQLQVVQDAHTDLLNAKRKEK